MAWENGLRASLPCSDPQNPGKKWGAVQTPIIPDMERWEEGGSLKAQWLSSLCGEVPANDRACLKTKGEGTLKNDTGSGHRKWSYDLQTQHGAPCKNSCKNSACTAISLNLHKLHYIGVSASLTIALQVYKQNFIFSLTNGKASGLVFSVINVHLSLQR